MPIVNTSEVDATQSPSLDGTTAVLVGPGAAQALASIFDSASSRIVLAPSDVTVDESSFPELDPASINERQVGLFTSGSTGTPKLHFHSLESLAAGANANHPGKVWGLLYQPYRMAGIQVLLQAVASKAMVVEPTSDATLEDVVDQFIDGGVDSLSGTPSRWRMILSTPNHRQMKLKYIALGGEISNQKILDDLRLSYPDAQIRHIYAATETGPIFSISDGLEGFPEEMLSRPLASGRSLSIEDGQLRVTWTDRKTSETKSFITGDLVEVEDGRVFFRGRADDLVNVGGNKITLHQVETAILAQEAVDECLAYAIPNPFLGSVIGVDVKWKSEPMKDLDFKLALMKLLPKHAIPAVINHVETIELSSAFKKQRKI